MSEENRRILALDYGRVHTGVAISDPSGTISRPLGEVEDAAGEEGLRTIASMVREHGVGEVLVGMPVSLSGERGRQAGETERFVAALRDELPVDVRTWDERFTSKLAADRGRDSSSSRHALAACLLLESFLGSRDYRLARGGGHGGEAATGEDAGDGNAGGSSGVERQ
jgi:putative Holliday junction resolvase